MTGAKTRILFVDDEPEVLAGLRTLLRKRRKVWAMTFAEGPEAALEHLASAAFDVVVSDVRMPGMDGVTLLERVRETQPQAARIVLTGECDGATSLRAAKVAHRFLSKPCDPALLAEAVERSAALQRELHDPALRALVGRVDRLPPAPSVYAELCERGRADDVTVAELSAIVERDPSLSAKVLQLVNSSYFGFARQIASVQAAVAYLGLETMRDLILAAKVFDTPRARGALDPDALAAHGMETARLVRALEIPGADRDVAATAALVHDVGLVAIACANPEALAAVGGDGARDPERNRSAWGTDHAAVGAYLLGLWGLPTAIVEAVALHHRPAEAAHTPTAFAVCVADVLSEMPEGADPIAEGALDPALLADLGLLDRVGTWLDALAEIRNARRKAA